MARLALGNVAVHEVKISAQRAIEECRAIRGGLSVANKGGERLTAEFSGQFADGVDRLRIQRANGNANRIKHADFQLFSGLTAQVLKTDPCDKASKLLHPGHGSSHGDEASSPMWYSNLKDETTPKSVGDFVVGVAHQFGAG